MQWSQVQKRRIAVVHGCGIRRLQRQPVARYDYTKLPTSIVNIELEPYVVIFDNDYTADYVGSTTINTGGGLNVFASDAGLTISMDLPLIRVETIETPIAIRCINGIVPTNGDIQIAGVGDTIVTASQFSEG